MKKLIEKFLNNADNFKREIARVEDDVYERFEEDINTNFLETCLQEYQDLTIELIDRVEEIKSLLSINKSGNFKCELCDQPFLLKQHTTAICSDCLDRPSDFQKGEE